MCTVPPSVGNYSLTNVHRHPESPFSDSRWMILSLTDQHYNLNRRMIDILACAQSIETGIELVVKGIDILLVICK